MLRCVEILLHQQDPIFQLADPFILYLRSLFHFGQVLLDRSQLGLRKPLIKLFCLHAGPGDVNVRHVAAELPPVAITEFLPIQLRCIKGGRGMPE
jgi:hypothetical protein